MEGSELTVLLSFGVNIQNSSKTTPESFAVLKLGDQFYKSMSRTGTNPVWHEKYMFDIKDPSVPIKFQLFNKETISIHLIR